MFHMRTLQAAQTGQPRITPEQAKAQISALKVRSQDCALPCSALSCCAVLVKRACYKSHLHRSLLEQWRMYMSPQAKSACCCHFLNSACTLRRA